MKRRKLEHLTNLPFKRQLKRGFKVSNVTFQLHRNLYGGNDDSHISTCYQKFCCLLCCDNHKICMLQDTQFQSLCASSLLWSLVLWQVLEPNVCLALWKSEWNTSRMNCRTSFAETIEVNIFVIVCPSLCIKAGWLVGWFWNVCPSLCKPVAGASYKTWGARTRAASYNLPATASHEGEGGTTLRKRAIVV